MQPDRPQGMYAFPVASPLYRSGDWISDSFFSAHISCPVFGRLATLANRDGVFRMTADSAAPNYRRLPETVAESMARIRTVDLTPARIREQAPHLPSGTSWEDVKINPAGEPWYVDYGDELLVYDGARCATATMPDPGTTPVDEWWLTPAGALATLPCLVGTARGERRFLITAGMLDTSQVTGHG